MSEVLVPSYVSCFIYIRRKQGILFNFHCAVYDVCKQSGTLWPEVRIRLFAHFAISQPSSWRLIWRHWTCKLLIGYIQSDVCLRLSQFLQWSFMHYIVLYVSSLPISVMKIARIYLIHVSIIINSKICITSHCVGLCHETMECLVCRAVFLWHGWKLFIREWEVLGKSPMHQPCKYGLHFVWYNQFHYWITFVTARPTDSYIDCLIFSTA